MAVMTKLIDKIWHRIITLRWQPIRVFCFHQTSETFDASTMWECDWTQIDIFKRNILHLKKQYTFISLAEAYEKLRKDRFRCKKYAVLTADDGWASMKNIIPWLAEQGIPVTLFINSAYIDGLHYQDKKTEKLLTIEDINQIVSNYPECVSIASHGETHIDVRKLSIPEFRVNVRNAEMALADIANKISFYAFTYGRCTKNHIIELLENHLVPVLADGMTNYRFDGVVHRECIDGKEL